jgi:hypothetical protein
MNVKIVFLNDNLEKKKSLYGLTIGISSRNKRAHGVQI